MKALISDKNLMISLGIIWVFATTLVAVLVWIASSYPAQFALGSLASIASFLWVWFRVGAGVAALMSLVVFGFYFAVIMIAYFLNE